MKKTGLILIALLLLAQAAAAETFGWDEDNNGETFIGLGMGFKGGTLYTLPEPGNLTSISATIHSTMSGNQIISAAIYDSNQELIAFTDEYTVPISGIDQILADMPFSETISLRPGDYYLLFGGDSSIRFGLDMAGGTSTLEGTYAYDWHNNISDFRNFGPSATVKIVVYGNYNLPVAATPEIVSVEGNPVNGVIPHFSSANDGDLTIRFTALNSEGGGVTADLNYSAQDMQGTGTAIATGLMLNGVVCEDDDFSNETSCSIEWDISGVEEGNYFLGLGLDNWAVTGFDASENSFAIDATGPEATVTKMNEEEVAGVLLSFNAEEDDNITINFDMLDAVGGNIVVDVNYSLQNIEGTGFVLEKGLALDAIVCKDADFTNSTECNVTWNLIGIPSGSYYINILSKDGLFTSFKTMVAPVQIYRPSAPESGELPPFCGDNKCNGNEWAGICPKDCSQACGDTACTHTESITTCSEDCFGCGDNICATDENNQTCPTDCLTLTCGDNQCTEGESCLSCAEDCGTCETITVIAETKLGKEQTTDQKIKVQRLVTVEGAMQGEGNPAYRSTVTIQVTNVSGNDLSNIKIRELLREDIAGNASELKTDLEYVEVLGGTAIEFMLLALAKGETVEIVYFVEKNINTEALAGWNAPVVLEMQEVIGTAKSCNKDRDCDDSNPCTKELCITGQCGIIPELDGTICGQLKECRQMKCVDIMVEKAGPQEDPAPFTYATIATTAVIIIAGYYLTKKYI